MSVLLCIGIIVFANGAIEYNTKEKEAGIAPDEVIRFHIVADDNTEEKQREKLMLRDALLREFMPLWENCRSKEELRRRIWQQLPQMERQCREQMAALGSDDTVQVAYGVYAFPLKYYGAFSLPGGEYEALKITLGKGQGENWWCMLYPQMCFNAAGEPLDSSEADAQGGKDTEIKLSWRIGEWWKSLW